ncbi:MAG TPA: tRNA (adenosine(37)-N6)-threonylcarbamoyltransferase complex ATPase subunit type 1 TsaE, partial [Chitinophagaceae bacterium]|nr:tRNA (adenosine(37)-N6)-threonylcarbamoyltransferase complex ATPase subunit type 1 TsaE [Chitinophagaceae bacterium]
MEMQISIDDLGKFAEAFWKYVKSSKVFAFHGEMGAGKTTIIKILCKRKGVLDSMSSPSFSIINEYEYKNNGETKRIFHIDLYRLEHAEEAV